MTISTERMQEKLSFTSDGLKLSAVLHVPDAAGPASGCLRSSCCTASSAPRTNCMPRSRRACWRRLGYARFRIDFRGCGESEGARGQVRCFDQVADTKNALTLPRRARGDRCQPHRRDRPQLRRGGCGLHRRGRRRAVACVISSCGWGHGERKFRGQHPTPEAWAKFTDMLAQGREHKARDRREHVGVALRRRSDPGTPAPEPVTQGASWRCRSRPR